MSTLKNKRKEMDRITAEMIRLIAKRNRTAEEIGKIKKGKNITDRKRESAVISAAAAAAKKYNVDAGLAEKVMKILISHSKKIQRRKND